MLFGLVLHELHFLTCSLMALLPDFETFKCSPALILKCLADVPMYVTFISREQVNLYTIFKYKTREVWLFKEKYFCTFVVL